MQIILIDRIFHFIFQKIEKPPSFFLHVGFLKTARSMVHARRMFFFKPFAKGNYVTGH